ncbi:hypothetical protein [Gottfriedia luciferensis]|uniref:hypothetical protein n=1 Tax=Gottfriedia luciferensis TaxID=178774 RepID=UPI000B433F4A|nr:hypothetical protein [Gottfriedia luciferensis]
MLQVKVKIKERRFTIPIPYAILHLAISILSSRFLHQQMNKWLEEQNEHKVDKKISLTIPQIDKKLLKPVIKELQKSKGLVLVNVKAQDGTEVLVKL